MTDTATPMVDAPPVSIDTDLPSGIIIPTREQITSRVIEHVRCGGELTSMVASDILDLPTSLIQQARDENTFEAPRVTSVYTESRNAINQPVSEGLHLTVSGSGSRNVVKDTLTPYFQREGLYTVLELTTGAGVGRVIDNVPEGMALIQVPNQTLLDTRRAAGAIPADETFENVTIEGISVPLAPPSYRQMFVDSATWTDIYIDGVTQPVAAVRSDGRTIVMFAGLFLTESWNGWSRSERDSEAKGRVFERIFTACREHLTNIRVKPVDNPHYADIRSRVNLFESIKALGVAHLDQFESRLVAARETSEQKQQEIDTARETLTAALIAKSEADEQVIMYSENRNDRVTEAISAAFESVQRLSNLRSIRKVEFLTTNNGSPKLHIETYDMAMDCKDTSGRSESKRRLIKGLKFDLSISGSSPQVTFDCSDITTPSPHPHISTSGNVCWGQATTPLAEAAGRKDWVTLVNIIIRWAATYNAASPYVERAQFPETDHPTGWIIED